MKKDETQGSWDKFLNPTSLKSNLIKASIYIVFFEQLKSSIIEKIESFYICGFKDGKYIFDKEYKERFYKEGVNRFDESLNWLIENKAISVDDKKQILELKKHRNEITHEMLNFIASTEKEVNDDLLASCYEILAKIDRWWIREVEIPTNPDASHIDMDTVEDSEIQSMSMILLQMLSKVYTGNDKELEEIYNKFINDTSQ